MKPLYTKIAPSLAVLALFTLCGCQSTDDDIAYPVRTEPLGEDYRYMNAAERDHYRQTRGLPPRVRVQNVGPRKF